MVSAETEPRSMRDGILWEQKSIGFSCSLPNKKESVVQRMMD
jgi:hypothetical protein